MMWIVIALVSVLLAAVVGWILPAWSVKRLAREAAEAGWRDAPILGLGWFVWAVGIATAFSLVGLALLKVDTAGMLFGLEIGDWRAAIDYSPFGTSIAVVPLLLVMGTLGLGLAEDAFARAGSRTLPAASSGLSSIRIIRGACTWALAMVTAFGIANTIARVDPMVRDTSGWMQNAYLLLAWVAATIVIALAARLVNSSAGDTSRALLLYTVPAILGGGLSVWGLWQVMERNMIQSVVNVSVAGANAAIPGLPAGAEVWIWLAGVIGCVAVLVMGPALVVRSGSGGGSAVLGSSGTLAMGAFAGYLLARSAPLWLLGVFALALIGLNLAIRSVRVAPEPEIVVVGAGIGADDGAWAGGPAAEDDDARRDDVS